MAFRIGIDCNNIRGIIHSGVPYTMEEYCKELGWPERDDLPARANSYYNSYNNYFKGKEEHVRTES